MSKNLQVLVFVEDEEVRFRIRPQVDPAAPEDKTVVLIDSSVAAAQGVELDQHGFPTASSLEAWHRKNNPHLFEDGE